MSAQLDLDPNIAERFWVTRLDFKDLLVPFHSMSAVRPGNGVIMRNGVLGDYLQTSPFATTQLVETQAALPAPAYGGGTSGFTSDMTLETEALYAHAYFRVGSTINAAYTEISKRRTQSLSWYLYIDWIENVPSIPATDAWASPPYVQVPDAPPESPEFGAAVQQFIEQYGSHYVDAITRGWKLIAQVSVKTEDKEKLKEVRLAVKAWGVSAGGSVAWYETFRHESVTVQWTVVGTPVDVEGKPISIGGPLEQLQEFLSEYYNERIRIISNPIYVNVRSLRPSLTKAGYPQRALLHNHPFYATSGAPPIYGVPAGTIVPWLPKQSDWVQNDDATWSLRAPPGWTFLANQYSHPEAGMEYFLMGSAIDHQQIGTFGGKPTHNHEGSTSGPSGVNERCDGGSARNAAWVGHTHTLTTSEAESKPPFFRIVYILREAD